MSDTLFELGAGGGAVCRPARKARTRSAPAPDPERERVDGFAGVSRVAGEWRYMVLLPDGRRETGESESVRDAWADARQVLRNARGY